jgi:hypothetical protein
LGRWFRCANWNQSRVTVDAALVAHLRSQRPAEVLQAPQRGRQPASGRPKYILKLYPNADAPTVPATTTRAKQMRRAALASRARIPWFLLAPLAEAVSDEYRRQRSSISAQLDREVESLETQLRSTRDRIEKRRLADALQTALHADEDLEAELAKRLYAKIANSDQSYSLYVDAIDWSNVPQSGNGK